MTATERRERMADRMTEAQFQVQVRDLMRLTGWRSYHTFDSRRSDPGFPDIAAVHRTQGRVIFIELKAATGRLSGPQRDWLTFISEAGFEADVWRPADMDRIKAILRGQTIPTRRAPEEFQ